MTPIRRLRHSRGRGLADAARAAGVTPGHLAAIERGAATLTWHRAQRLATLYDTPIEALLMGRPGQAQPVARRGRRRVAFEIGARVEVVCGQFDGVRGVVDKPSDEAPLRGRVGVTACGPVGSGAYLPEELRRVTMRRGAEA